MKVSEFMGRVVNLDVSAEESQIYQDINTLEFRIAISVARDEEDRLHVIHAEYGDATVWRTMSIDQFCKKFNPGDKQGAELWLTKQRQSELMKKLKS